MKKLKTLIVLGLSLVMAFFFGACSSGATLSTPTDFSIDEYNTLSWSPVRSARSYRIEIYSLEGGERKEDTTRRVSYSLSMLEEGDYEIRVMAIGGSQSTTVSPWSAKIEFHKDYDSGLIYTLINNNTEYMVSKVGAAQGDVTIVDYYRDKPVTAIGAAAFRASKVERVTIGNNVTAIGENAFYQCPLLETVEMSDSVTSIGTSAFQGCTQLSEITLSAQLAQVPDLLFTYCKSLKKIELNEGLQSIGARAFYSCTALEEITIPDSVKSIGEYAFSASTDTALTSVEMGSGIQSIGEYAFSNNTSLATLTFKETDGLTVNRYAFAACDALTEITLPAGLVSLGDSAFFSDDNLAEATLPESLREVGKGVFNGTALYKQQQEENTHGGFIYADNWLVAVTSETLQTLPEVISADAEFFKEGVVGFSNEVMANASTLLSLTLPSTVKYLGAYALYNCSKLYSFITSNGSLEEIGNSAFAECGNLSNIRFGTGLKKIGAYAFYNSNAQNNPNNPHLLVPQSVESIGRSAFVNTSLWSNPDASGVVYAGKWAVGYTRLTTSEVSFPNDIEGVADYAFFNCTDLRSVMNLQVVEHIGQAAFAKCENLGLISSLYRYLERIEDMTFYGCYSLFGVELPRELKEIGYGAFAQCSVLNEIDLSDTDVKTIEDFAFYGCNNAKTIDLGDFVETIGAYAFYQSYSVTELVFPKTLREIGERAFALSNATTVAFNEGLETIGRFAFKSCKNLTGIQLPDSVKTVGDYAFYDCDAVTELDLGDGVEYIGRCAFYGLNRLTSLALPASLAYLDDYAFVYCTSLRSLSMLGEIGYVGAHVFYGCNYMTFYASCDQSVADNWSIMWNSTYRPVLWGCTADEGYVVSFTLTEDTFANGFAWYGIGDPVRAGYTFAGWAISPNGEAVYTGKDLKTLESGTTLYAVWTENISDGSEQEQ